MSTITDTEITTTARRIARNVNATVKEVAHYYAADGTVLEGGPSDMSYVRGVDEPAGSVLRLAGRRNAWVSGGQGRGPVLARMSYREAQDRLDAAAAGVDYWDYEQELRWARRTWDDGR